MILGMVQVSGALRPHVGFLFVGGGGGGDFYAGDPETVCTK